jgi:hypothetical protein
MRNLALLLTMLSSTCAMAVSPGVWDGGSGKDSAWAVVRNEGGSTFGKVCIRSSGACSWVIYIDTRCDDGKSVPALFASRAGTASGMIGCGGPVGEDKINYLYTITEVDVEELVSYGGVAGVVIGLQDGSFSSYRFNVDGAKAAIKALDLTIGAGATKKSPTGTGNKRAFRNATYGWLFHC